MPRHLCRDTMLRVHFSFGRDKSRPYLCAFPWRETSSTTPFWENLALPNSLTDQSSNSILYLSMSEESLGPGRDFRLMTLDSRLYLNQ